MKIADSDIIDIKINKESRKGKNLNANLSTNTASIGNPVYAVLLDATGTVLATTNTLTISSPNLGTFQTLNFATNQSLTASTNYYLGFAQTTNSVVGYFPIGAYNTPYVAYPNYGTTALTGGLVAPLTSNLGYFAIEGIFETKLNLTVNSGTICAGNSFTMVPSGASTYTFSGGSAIVTPTATSSYSITGTNSNGCVGANSAISNITVNPAPVIIVSSGAVCIGGSWTITPTGATTYTYSSGSAVVSPTATSSYTVSGSSAAGCQSSTVITISVNPTLAFSANSGSVCIGSTFTMTPSGASSYTFSSGTPVVTPTTTTTYTIVGVNSVGCYGTQICTVTVNALPIVSATTSNTLICLGESAVLTASTTATSYTWNTGATTLSVSVSPTITSTYTVNVSNAASCSASSMVMITVSPCIGINEIFANSISVYPNPNNGLINISLTSELAQHSSLEIYDAIGKLVVKQVLANELNAINISNLNNGIYLFKVLNNSNIIKIGKLIKE
jgi:hypothetical protein